jgi:antirestriction protein ArdC
VAIKDKKKPVQKKKKSNADIYEEVTAKVIASLETGEVPWKKPWISQTYMNYVSKRPYRGINPFLLSISASTNGYESPYWLTYNQANELSIKKYLKDNGLKDSAENRESYDYKEHYTGIKKGEKSTMIIFWSVFEVEDEDAEDGKKTIKYLKYINVFNTDQTDLGITYDKSDGEFNPIEDAAKVIKDWEDRPNINHLGFDRACYIPSSDIIEMPKQEDFVSPELYYKTLYHECIHATGHKNRVGRVNDWSSFGSDPYAKEELVAELGASFLLNYVGIENEDTEENTEAYIKNWIAKLKSDPKLIVQAGSQAQKGADYILGTKYEPVEDKE